MSLPPIPTKEPPSISYRSPGLPRVNLPKSPPPSYRSTYPTNSPEFIAEYIALWREGRKHEREEPKVETFIEVVQCIFLHIWFTVLCPFSLIKYFLFDRHKSGAELHVPKYEAGYAPTLSEFTDDFTQVIEWNSRFDREFKNFRIKSRKEPYTAKNEQIEVYFKDTGFFTYKNEDKKITVYCNGDISPPDPLDSEKKVPKLWTVIDTPLYWDKPYDHVALTQEEIDGMLEDVRAALFLLYPFRLFLFLPWQIDKMDDESKELFSQAKPEQPPEEPWHEC